MRRATDAELDRYNGGWREGTCSVWRCERPRDAWRIFDGDTLMMCELHAPIAEDRRRRLEQLRAERERA